MARPVLINSEDVGYNLPELLRLAADQHVRREANKASRLDSGSAAGEQDARAVAKLTLSARDNFLRMDGKRRILADNLVIAAVGKSAKLKLQHCMGLGLALFCYQSIWCRESTKRAPRVMP